MYCVFNSCQCIVVILLVYALPAHILLLEFLLLPCTAGVLMGNCLYAVLLVCCSSTARQLPAYCSCAASALLVCCSCTARVLLNDVLLLCFSCTARVLLMHCSCAAHVLLLCYFPTLGNLTVTEYFINFNWFNLNHVS